MPGAIRSTWCPAADGVAHLPSLLAEGRGEAAPTGGTTPLAHELLGDDPLAIIERA